MNQIVIKSDNTESLENFLINKLSDCLIKRKETEITLLLENQTVKDKLSLALAVFITSQIENECTDNLKNTISPEKYNEEAFQGLHDEYKKFLYIEPVRILILEHLKHNNKINIESFITFNCRGLQKEFYNYGKDFLQLYLQEFQNGEKFSSKTRNSSLDKEKSGTLSVDSAATYYSYIKELNDLIFKLKQESNIKNFDYKKFNEVHVKAHGDKLILTDNKNKLICEELNNMLPINLINSLQGGDEILKVAITLITYISILKTSCVVIHKSIPDETINRILLYLYDSREVNSELYNVNLLQCNSCSMCDLVI